MARTLLEPASRNGTPPVVESRTAGAGAVMSLSPPKQRRSSWVVVGVAVAALAAMLAAWVFASSTARLSVLVAAREISPGEVISGTDLRVVDMGRTGGLRAIQPSQQDLIVGRAARGPIPEGTVLNTDLFADRATVVPPGMAVVGAALEAGAVPTPELAAGDRVELFGATKTTSADGVAPVAVLLASGTVWSVNPVGTGANSSKLWVSMLVPADVQPAVMQAAADGRLRVALAGGGS